LNKIILSGNEAIAQGAYESGIRLATSYPGTPASEIMDFLLKKKSDNFYAEWSTNEKIALEICFGASTVKQRSLCSMKANGINLCIDSLMSLTKKGITGGLVIAVIDDPDARYSDVVQDSSEFMNVIGFPILKPTTIEECREMTIKAFKLSEEIGKPVFINTTNKIGHLYKPIKINERNKPKKAVFDKTPFKFNPYSKEKEKVIPYFCNGCPHDSFYDGFCIPNDYIVNGDIGCYEMAGFGNNGKNDNPKREIIDTLFVMGSGINVAQGQIICGQKAIALCGDSTFWHSGINGLINAACNKHQLTYFIMDNSCIAMTGQQPTPQLSIEKTCESLGCNVKIVNPYKKEEVENSIKSALNDTKQINIIISRAPCMLRKMRDLKVNKK
jgi:TPP-dependent indolepyruvate ferredoxin oxidoreductase alpha subunit